jgi:FKBP-type peptidyl-prolyl cis-trans isomerase
VPTSKQRREAARRHLERQLQRRQDREQARRRFTLIASIVGTVVLIGAIVAIIAVASGGDKKKTADNPVVSPTATPTAPTSSASSSPARAAKGAAVTFSGVKVTGAADLGGAPGVTSKSSTVPSKLLYKDLVVGKGKAASDTSTVTVQYVGVLYKDGTKFDSSWDRGQTAQFSLTGVVKGFTYGIGGTSGVPPMKAGGRRIIIIPSTLGYGAQANGSIPANAPLVFVVDLKSVDASS